MVICTRSTRVATSNGGDELTNYLQRTSTRGNMSTRHHVTMPTGFSWFSLSIVGLMVTAPWITAAPLGNGMMGNGMGVAKKYSTNAAKDYLIKFQHIDKKSSDPVTDEDLQNGLLSLQKFAGIDQTGELDKATQNLMSTPRCGLTDAKPFELDRFLTGAKWMNRRLTYRISSYPSASLSSNDVNTIVSKAYKRWTDVTNLTISETDASNTDLKINFYSYDHGDGYPLDGPGGVLAHAWGTPWGMVHFDNSETWTNGSTAGINFLQVATHEFGHSLGLQHSGVATAVMFPYYMGYNANFRLDPDDISGIQSLYGRRVGT